MIIAVDFDDTLSFAEYPDVKLDFQPINILRRARRNGHKIILWTCRHGDALDKAVTACRNAGLEFDAVNSNDPEQSAEWSALTGETEFSPKVYADYYIDEKAYPDRKVDWDAWDRKLNAHGTIIQRVKGWFSDICEAIFMDDDIVEHRPACKD